MMNCGNTISGYAKWRQQSPRWYMKIKASKVASSEMLSRKEKQFLSACADNKRGGVGNLRNEKPSASHNHEIFKN